MKGDGIDGLSILGGGIKGLLEMGHQRGQAGNSGDDGQRV